MDGGFDLEALKKRAILLSLESTEQVLVDCWDDSDSLEFERDWGCKRDMALLVLSGLIRERTDGKYPTTTSAIKMMVSRHVADALQQFADGFSGIVTAEEPQIQLTHTSTETHIVERSESRQIAAGATDKHELLQLLREGRRLTPAQRKLLGMKRCSRCKEIKEFAEFRPSNYADGYFAWCNACDALKQLADTEPESEEADDSTEEPAELDRRDVEAALTPRNGMLQCNVCSVWVDKKILGEHKRREHRL